MGSSLISVDFDQSAVSLSFPPAGCFLRFLTGLLITVRTDVRRYPVELYGDFEGGRCTERRG